MNRILTRTCVELVSLLTLFCVSGLQARQEVSRADQPGKPAQQQVVADPDAPNRALRAPSETIPQLVVPRLVKFSGIAKDEMGKPRTGTLGITLAIYKDPVEGTPLWLETQNVELDQQGRYTALLGATKSEGLPLELFTTGEPRWLAVQVNLPGEVEQPRVLLVSVPYALKAVDADTVGGLPASAFMLAAANGTSTGTNLLGTTTQTSTGPKMTGKAATSRAAKNAATAAAIATNFIPVFTDNTGTLGSSAMSQSGSNIGIGTTTPGAALDVNGGARALFYGFLGNAAAPADATPTIFNQAFVGPTFSGLSFSVRTGTPTPANAFTVDANQNVTISGNTNMGGNAGALAYKFTGNAALPTDATATILNAAFVGPVFSGLSFRVRTGATPADALTVDQNQNVGIGTTAPATKLHAQNGASTLTSLDLFPIDGLAGECNSSGCAALDAITSAPGGFGVFADVTGSGTTAVLANSDVGNSVEADTGTGNAIVAAVSGGCTGSTSSCNILVGFNSLGDVVRIDNTGRGFFNGGTQTSGADFAEAVAVRGQRSQYEPGDLLVIDVAAGRRLMLSRRAYSSRVAGIYSTKPGVLATTHSIDESTALAEEIPLAIVGIVPCKVTAENGPIAPGDLLVTSSTPGRAMKGTNRLRMLGAVVGKALEPLQAGTGVIQVLVTLQ